MGHNGAMHTCQLRKRESLAQAARHLGVRSAGISKYLRRTKTSGNLDTNESRKPVRPGRAERIAEESSREAGPPDRWVG